MTHVLMIGLDTTILRPNIMDTRLRHETYARELDGHISMVVCSKDSTRYPDYETERVVARATHSSGYFAYLRDGFRAAMRFHAEHPVDVITAQDPFLTALIGLNVRRRLRVPLIMQDHSSFIGSPYFVRERARNRLMRLAAFLTLPRADAVRVMNRRERLAMIRIGVRPDRVCVVPTATDTSGFTKPIAPEIIADWRAQLEITPDTPTILWVGRPVAFKALSVLFSSFQRVLAQMPDARLIVVGDMTGTNYVGQAAARGISHAVKFVGSMPHADLPPFYQLATIYALSSTYEGLGRVLIEAAAAGLPIVSTDTQGPADMITDGLTGLIVPIGDDQALANGMLTLLRDPELRKKLAERARQYVQANYDEHKLMAQWAAMMRRVATRQKPCES